MSLLEISFEDYRALPGVNASALVQLHESALAYRHYVDNGSADTSAMSLGRLAHMAVLEPERFKEVVVYAGTRRGKAWDAFQLQYANSTVATAKEYEKAKAIACAVRLHPAASQYLRQEGVSEASFTWERDNFICKGRLDRLTTDNVLIDLKTAADVSVRGFSRAIAQRHYHERMAWYAEGIAAATGRDVQKHVLIAVQSAEPYDVVVYRMSGPMIEAGGIGIDDLWTKWKAHTQTGNWPGVSNVEVEIDLPAWAQPSEDLSLVIGGRKVAV